MSYGSSEILHRASLAGQREKAECLGRGESQDAAEAAGARVQAIYLASALERVIDDGERAQKARLPQPEKRAGLRLCKAKLGTKPVHLEYDTFNDDDETFANVIACWVDGARVICLEDEPFSVRQIEQWQQVALADYNDHRSYDPEPTLREIQAYELALVENGYHADLDRIHDANHRLAA